MFIDWTIIISIFVNPISWWKRVFIELMSGSQTEFMIVINGNRFLLHSLVIELMNAWQVLFTVCAHKLNFFWTLFTICAHWTLQSMFIESHSPSMIHWALLTIETCSHYEYLLIQSQNFYSYTHKIFVANRFSDFALT